MSQGTTVLLGALVGLTIFLGLPLARVRRASPAVKGFLNAAANGILLFLLWDVLSKATEPITAALAAVHAGRPGQFALLAVLFVLGLGMGLMSLVYFNSRVGVRLLPPRLEPRPGPGAALAKESTLREAGSGRSLAMMIAIGLGLHNFSEGLAIGQSAAAGAITFALVLVIGFGLHNITEGFGIAAPMAADAHPPSWTFLGLAGLVGGGPTFLGTLIGYSVAATPLFVLFLALAAGALIYVIGEMFAVGRRLNRPALMASGVLAGFLAGMSTDLFLTYLGG